MIHARTILLGSLALGLCLAGAEAADMAPLAPKNEATSNTPLTVVLKWTPSTGAAAYSVELREVGGKLIATTRTQIAECRLAVCPKTEYRWAVWALGKQGRVLDQAGPWTFKTPKPVLQEITDNNVLFAGMRPNAHFVNMESVPSDPNAPLSPWFEKKTYDGIPPPTFEQVKDRLPKPIWDGHQDAIDMYWYAWQTLFGTWLYAPAQGHSAVANLVGMPTWAGWGSTMVLDTAFILQFARYGDAAYPFITSLDNCYARQHESGFICRETENHNEEVSSSWPVNPPLLAWSEWSYYEVTGDVERLREVFLPLVKQYEWYMLYQRRMEGGYWTIGVNEADDSPRIPLAHEYISTTCTQAYSAEILAKIAKLIGREDMVGWFAGEYKSLSKQVNARFWDEEHKIYNDLGTDGKPITVTKQGGVCKHCHDFWPLVAGIATGDRARYMAEAATDEKTFLVSSGVASLSRDSNGFVPDTGAYWRGSVWPPVQCMVIKGLERAGNEKAALTISQRYYDSFLTAYKAKGDITEFLVPDKPEMLGCGKFVGWGGVAPIQLLIENILGIRANAPANRVTWHINRLERHGIESLRFGKHTVSLICEARSSETEPCKITVESNGAFDLVIGRVTKHIKPGKSTFEVTGH